MPELHKSLSTHLISPPQGHSEDAEQLLQTSNEVFKAGKLKIKCIEASNIRRKDQTASKTILNPFLRFTLGPTNEHAITMSTKPKPTAHENPIFDEENVEFLINSVSELYCVAEDKQNINLKIEVAETILNDDNDLILGSVIISANRFFHSTEIFDEWIPLFQPGDTTTNSSIHLQISFLPVKEGMIVLELLSYHSLVESDSIESIQQIVADLSLGKGETKINKVVTTDKESYYFKQEKLYFTISSDNWFYDLDMKLYKSCISGNNFIGSGKVSLSSYMSRYETTPKDEQDVVNIMNVSSENITKRNKIGSVLMKAYFLEAGEITIRVKNGKDLKVNDNFRTMDPYVLFTCDSNGSNIVRRTKAVTEGGNHPTWEEDLKFMVVDHCMMRVKCYDDDPFSNDHYLIGESEFSLMPAYEKGYMDIYLQLQKLNEFQKLVPSGQIHLFVEFRGPYGISFPLLQPSAQVHNKSIQYSSKDQHDMISSGNQVEGFEFIEEDIKSSFDFLDLDKNGYLGASEIKHVLICMGELITDEEIDMMISMLDSNGDGQISYQQFRRMVNSANPAEEDFSQPELKEPLTHHGNTNSMIEMERFNKKKEVFSSFVTNCRIGHKHAKKLKEYIISKIAMVDVEESDCISITVTHDNMCEVLLIDSTGETQTLFDLLDYSGSGKIDAIELFLCLSNFILFTTKERCVMIFEIFDRNKKGYISSKDIYHILIGSHMKSHKSIRKKAENILRHIDPANIGKISFDDLLTAAVKFPNLLFPIYSLSQP